ncbi:MAG TPA: MaoC family dehydratase [Pseudolabrys sp.]|nr:MaoC family dehydratase [Pseudolabrys sp.]
MKYFDDLRLGDLVMTGQHTFHADEIKAFARRFDPQPFHVDEEAAANSHFGALCASGWHTAAAWMRLLVDHRRAVEEDMRARGEPMAGSGPALGLRDLKWLKPVYVGDAINYKSEITELRMSGSRLTHGLMTILTTGVNQNGAPVISFYSTTFVERRPA